LSVSSRAARIPERGRSLARSETSRFPNDLLAAGPLRPGTGRAPFIGGFPELLVTARLSGRTGLHVPPPMVHQGGRLAQPATRFLAEVQSDMTANIASGRKGKVDAGFWHWRRFGYAAAVMFAGTGLVMLFGAMDDIPPLGQADAVFGLSTRAVRVATGLLHLAVSGCLFATRDPMKQGLVACWAGLNYIVYLAGLAWLKAAASIPAVVVVAWELGVSEKTVQIVWRLFIAYLVTVGFLLVVLEWRRLKNVEAEGFLKRWHESRERGDKAQ
jgi:hypothetical protein